MQGQWSKIPFSEVNSFVYMFLMNNFFSEVFVKCCILALLEVLKDGHTDKFVGFSTEY